MWSLSLGLSRMRLKIKNNKDTDPQSIFRAFLRVSVVKNCLPETEVPAIAGGHLQNY